MMPHCDCWSFVSVELSAFGGGGVKSLKSRKSGKKMIGHLTKQIPK
jgi:hypothetical protein